MGLLIIRAPGAPETSERLSPDPRTGPTARSSAIGTLESAGAKEATHVWTHGHVCLVTPRPLLSSRRPHRVEASAPSLPR
jgi:hypothetical protein